MPMADEQKLTQQFEEYAKLGKEHKEVNVASLMIHALEQAQREEVEQAKKRRAYMVSVFLPPIGYLYALWYFFSDKPDGRKVALNCAIITSVVLLITLLISKMIFASVPQQSASQLQNMDLNDALRQAQEMRQLTQ